MGGYIRSINLAAKAAAGSSGQITITVPEGYVVQIHFSYFDIVPGYGSFTAIDVAQDYTMTSPVYTQLASWAWRGEQKSLITSMNNQTIIQYYSSTVTGTGFCLTWTAIPRPIYNIGTFAVNIPTLPPLVALQGTIVDPSGGTGLNKMSDTRTLIQCPTNYTISVTFNYFCAIQSSEFYNFLVFYDGPFPSSWSTTQYRDNGLLAQYASSYASNNFSGCPNQVGGQPYMPPAVFTSTSNQYVVNFATEPQPGTSFTQSFSFNFTCQPVVPPTPNCSCCPYKSMQLGKIVYPQPPCSDTVSQYCCDPPKPFTCSDYLLDGDFQVFNDATQTFPPSPPFNPLWYYPAGLDCTATFAPPPTMQHYVIQVAWTFFDLTTDQGDKLYVWDQFTYHSGSIWLNDLYGPYGQGQYNNGSYLQGTSMPVTVTTYNPTLRIRFITNTSYSHGFAFTFTAIQRQPYNAGNFDATQLPIIAQTGYVQSIGYSGVSTQYQMAFFSAPPGTYYSYLVESINMAPADTFSFYYGPFDTTQLGNPTYLSNFISKATCTGDCSSFDPNAPAAGYQTPLKHTQFIVELKPSSGSSGSSFSILFLVFNQTGSQTNTADQYANADLSVVQLSGLTQGSFNSQTSSNNKAMYALVSLVALPVLLLAAAIVIVKRRKSHQQSADQQFYETPSSIPNPKLEALMSGDMEAPEVICSVPRAVASPEIGQGYPSTPLRVDV
jgi:hypothetical protein